MDRNRMPPMMRENAHSSEGGFMRSRRKRKSYGKIAAACVLSITVIGTAAFFLIRGGVIGEGRKEAAATPEELLLKYVSDLEARDYAAMYALLDEQSRININQEEYTVRNQNIYDGIEASNIRVQITGTEEREDKKEDKSTAVKYEMSLDTAAGPVSFSNEAVFHKEETEGKPVLKMRWSDQMIFPRLGRADKIRVVNDKAVRGSILDREGAMLAGKGTACAVGLVPGRMSAEPGPDLDRMADLLGVSRESIEKKLAAKWVNDESFVPIRTLKKVDEMNLQSASPDEANMQNRALQEELLLIPGVMISDTEVRSYPLGQRAAHLTGYIQNVTAEDLDKHAGEDYLTDSVIGRSGMETLFEKELKGQNGRSILLVGPDGTVKENLAAKARADGQDITLTIDSRLQTLIYDNFRDVNSCTVAMNPYTGEILALVSTPSYDDNDFILGMSDQLWTSLNEDEGKPLYNRFRQRFAPGSSFKPITGAIGLGTGAIDPEQDYGDEGLSWQKDESWGNYRVTTLHSYSPVNLENAFIYSDNIYFAKAALRIGYEDFMKGLDALGFNQELPFDISVAQSQYSNTDQIETEIQLADSGYGQGQILVNPIHLASLYTMFANGGNVIQPYLQYKKESQPEIWIPGACSPETADRIEAALVKVISSEHGTGHAAYRSDLPLAGKTGTAEIKASKEDKTGTELGWFAVYTPGQEGETPLLIVSMVEDVKNSGGSGLVVRKVKAVLDSYIPSGQ